MRCSGRSATPLPRTPRSDLPVPLPRFRLRSLLLAVAAIGLACAGLAELDRALAGGDVGIGFVLIFAGGFGLLALRTRRRGGSAPEPSGTPRGAPRGRVGDPRPRVDRPSGQGRGAGGLPGECRGPSGVSNPGAAGPWRDLRAGQGPRRWRGGP